MQNNVSKERIDVLQGSPLFVVRGGLPVGLSDGPDYNLTLATNFKCNNSQELRDRCLRAWADNSIIYFHFLDASGQERKLPIQAAERTKRPDGHDSLTIWLIANPYLIEGLNIYDASAGKSPDTL